MAHEGMVKFASIWEQPGDNAALDRWYRTTHSREAVLFVGPWLRRYWAYRGYNVPAEADAVAPSRYRLTEMWYGNDAERREGARAWQSLSPPPRVLADPNRRRTAQIFVPAIPDERYMDGWPREQPSYFRWVFFMRYPPEVALETGEAWFRDTFAPKLLAAPGVRRFVGHHSVDPPTSGQGWVRMCEVWFDSYEAWKAATLDAAHEDAPPWGGTYPYVPIISIFTDQAPDFDFLRDGHHAPL
jgi:hypothetical protein